MWGSMGWGGVSEGEEGGGGVHHHRPKPPPPKRSPTPPPPAPKKRKFSFESSDERDHGAIPRPKRPKPPPPTTTTARPTKAVPAPKPTNPPKTATTTPAPPTKTDTPKGAEKKDDRPEDPIVGTVVHVPYPKGVERGTVRGIRGRKYGAVWVGYRGRTTLYEVNRSLLFPTPEEAERHREEARAEGPKKTKPPTPQTKRLTPRTQTLPPNPLTQLTPLTPLTPHPDPQRCGTPLRGATRYEGPDREPRGHNGHGQET